MSDVESHRITAPPETQACEGAEGAGILLSKMQMSRGTVGAETYADRTCTPPQVYGSASEVLAADKALVDSGKEPLKSFSLPAGDKKAQAEEVQNALWGLEEHAGHKLNYVWFDDDSGKAQIFLLGGPGKNVENTATAAPAATCKPFDQIVDESANLQENLPPGTNQGDAAKIINERGLRAAYVKAGIAANATEDEAKAIEADRAAQIQALEDRLPSPDFITPEQKERFDLDKSAIAVGLLPGSTADQIKQTGEANNLASRALRIGLDQNATKDDIDAVYKRIESSPDQQLNRDLGLPIYTTRGEALNQSLKWINDGEIIANGYSPDMTPDQRGQVNQERYQAQLPYRAQLESGNLSPDERDRAQLAIDAIGIGLPPDSSAQTVQETKDLYAHQGMAVSLGLNRDASPQAVQDAQERSDGELAKQMCVDK